MTLDMQPFGCIFISDECSVQALADESPRKSLDELHKSNHDNQGFLGRTRQRLREAHSKRSRIMKRES
ncbi:hypothetical protein Cflav_PD4442 [Pedosphaera parvula Ellin514]|uniref:Uncharacterized protein n=1 Tax=Pedosphaera parvula (strain Ellin514) TaxID=320771 RepID=B9XFQ7_PEDPL|nr:hypothetical protein Cflav_PD4442 [Pedosphaera parvula Ellin514]